MSANVTVVSNSFSEDTESHGLTLFLVTLDAAYAAKLVMAIRAFGQLYQGVSLGEVSRVLIKDEMGVYTEMDEDAGLDDDFTGAYGILKPGVGVPPRSNLIARSYLVVTCDHVMWEGHTRDHSIVESQALPLDFLEAVASDDLETAGRLASRRKSFDEAGRAVYSEI